MEWLLIIEKGLWCGLAGIGFSVLFNVPVRALVPIFIMAMLAGICKLSLVQFHLNIVIASLAGATLIGFLSILFAHSKHSPPVIFAIPAIIPMVPGIFAYRMMLGLITLAGNLDVADYNSVLAETVNTGLKVMLILMSLAGGVGVPMLLTRKQSAKEIRFSRRK